MMIRCRVRMWMLLKVSCSFFRYTEEMVPWHPCLQLISNCEQKLSSHTSRRLITMEKVKTFEVNYPSIFWINSGRIQMRDFSSFPVMKFEVQEFCDIWWDLQRRDWIWKLNSRIEIEVDFNFSSLSWMQLKEKQHTQLNSYCLISNLLVTVFPPK